MTNELEKIKITYEYLKDKIYIIRGKQVMLDSDLAKIYGYTTKAFNQQVKNNIEKFDEDFRFQLTNEETIKLSRSKILTSIQTKGIKGGRSYNPYAFTEQGIYMLMTVLKGELATRQSKALIKLFKGMKDFILNNKLIESNDLLKLSYQTNQNTLDINNIKENMATKKDLEYIMNNFIDKNRIKEKLILNGQIVESDLAYSMIYSSAKKSIFIIDNYIDLKTLVLLKNIKVDITIFSDNINKGLHKIEYLDFKKEYPNINISFKKTNGIFHDRYIILDYRSKEEKIYLCGASSKDSGKKITSIIQLDDVKIFHNIISQIINNNELNF